ncbi:hypothetical protein E2C01_068569 [Portunus trituberculatus]|uniref:Uncharacterized protein n=1 Tax=Portunus trituberculatus TaxID=210409 RepID=A0A5B7HY79_PORTR|nr:hypothetical protein [Portunus trituberculatus]
MSTQHQHASNAPPRVFPYISEAKGSASASVALRIATLTELLEEDEEKIATKSNYGKEYFDIIDSQNIVILFSSVHVRDAEQKFYGHFSQV